MAAYQFSDLTPEQLAYLRASINQIKPASGGPPLRDRVFTSAESFNSLPENKRRQLFQDLQRPDTQRAVAEFANKNYASKPPSELPASTQPAGTVTPAEQQTAKQDERGEGGDGTTNTPSTNPVITMTPGEYQKYEAENDLETLRQQQEERLKSIYGDEFLAQERDRQSNPDMARLDVIGGDRIELKGASTTTNFENRKQYVTNNPLHDYDDYTYNISLHTIDIQNFNAIIENPEIEYRPASNIGGNLKGTVLIAGGGRRGSNFQRNDFWNEDFFFDNLRITTGINTTALNPYSNVINLSFSVIEPNSFTLIDRLIAAVDQVGGQNYLLHPYILQIDFYGYKDGIVSSGPIKSLSKILPIKILRINSKNTQKGVDYTFDAVAFNHQAFNEVNVLSPANFTVRAKTVQDLFGRGFNNSIKLVDPIREDAQQDQRERNRSQTQATSSINNNRVWVNGYDLNDNKNVTSLSDIPQPTYAVSSFCDGYNSFYNNLINNKCFNYTNVAVTQIAVEFHESIGKENLIPSAGPQTVNQAAPAGNVANAKTAAQQAGGAAKNEINFDGSIVAIPANTRIDKLIEWAFRNSEYYRKYNDKYNSEAQGKTSTDQLQSPLKLYKVVPKIKILGYDNKSQRYALKITYFVKPYIMSGNSAQAPLGRQPGWVKEYNWIFTGGQDVNTGQNLSNKDVINLDIELNALYFQAVTVFKASNNMTETAKNICEPIMPFIDDGAPAKPLPPSVQGENQPIPWSKITPISQKFVTGDIRKINRNGYGSASAVGASDTIGALTNSAEMLAVNLKILGDPEFIKQDDIFYGQNAAIQTTQFTPNGSLWMDNSELYIWLNFESPIDYDESTGLAIPQRGYFNSFSGVYKLLLVENIFSKGKFTQELRLTRLAIDDQARMLKLRSIQRADTYVDRGLGQITPLAPVRFSGSVANLAQVGQQGLTNVTAALQQAAALPGSVANRLASAAIGTATNAITGAITKSVTDPLIKAGKEALDSVLGSGTLVDAFDPTSILQGDVLTQVTAELNPTEWLNQDLLTEIGFDSLDVGSELATELASDVTEFAGDALEGLADVGEEIFDFVSSFF